MDVAGRYGNYINYHLRIKNVSAIRREKSAVYNAALHVPRVYGHKDKCRDASLSDPGISMAFGVA